MFEIIHSDEQDTFKYDTEYFPVIVLSYVLFMLIYRYLVPFVSMKYTKCYSRLALNQKIEWDLRATSTGFSVIVSFLCIYVLVFDNGLASSPLYYDSCLVKTNISIVMGFTLFDLCIMVANYRFIGDVFTLIHHCISFFGYTQALGYSVMPYFANFRLVVEFSTPLVNMRWFFYICGYEKNSLHFFLNGILMTLAFFVVRIMSIPLFWFKVYTVLDSPVWLKMKYFRYVMIVTCLLLDIINIYWFNKLFKGAKLVWSANWQYYEKHHKTQQIEVVKSKILLVNNVICESTRQSLVAIVDSRRYISHVIPRNINFSKIIPFNNGATADDHHHSSHSSSYHTTTTTTTTAADNSGGNSKDT